MNLKEAFRYQKFLDSMMSNAEAALRNRTNALTTTKTHNKSAANPEATDTTEEIERPGVYFPNDSVVEFATWLIGEKQELTAAINRAKASIDFDLDAAVETNKYRQSLSAALKSMLMFKAGKTVEYGRDYKFNVNGDQVPYNYTIDVESTEAYDRAFAKSLIRYTMQESDEISAEIDAAMINTVVDYTPVYDVNESYEDVMTDFIVRNEDSDEAE